MVSRQSVVFHEAGFCAQMRQVAFPIQDSLSYFTDVVTPYFGAGCAPQNALRQTFFGQAVRHEEAGCAPKTRQAVVRPCLPRKKSLPSDCHAACFS
jgi:hypothetical protein